MKNIIKLLCPHCLSDDIARDAAATWDVDRGEWVMAGTHDDMTCQQCGEDFKEATEESAVLFDVTEQEHATIMAALRYYQQQGMGDPANRSDDIHDIATQNDDVISLDAEGIDDLCERINVVEVSSHD